MVFVPKENWDSLPVQSPAGRWLIMDAAAHLRAPGLRRSRWLLSLIDAFLHYAFPTWIALAPLVLVLAMRPYYAERRLGYTTWSDPKPVAASRDSQQ